jgi:hypothetical protein
MREMMMKKEEERRKHSEKEIRKHHHRQMTPDKARRGQEWNDMGTKAVNTGGAHRIRTNEKEHGVNAAEQKHPSHGVRASALCFNCQYCKT